MKTQIENLINGQKNVTRLENHAKYENAKQATSHIGYAGTNQAERQEIVDKVFGENGQLIYVIFNGNCLILNEHSSKSGKTRWYDAEISEDIAKNFVNTDGAQCKYTLVMQPDCTMCIVKNIRKNENCEWKHSYTQYIDEAYLTII